MNYRAIAETTLQEYIEEYPHYTLGEILYSFLREPVSGAQNIRDIKKLTEEDLYTFIEKAKNQEKE